jgi:hypothetical protein
MVFWVDITTCTARDRLETDDYGEAVGKVAIYNILAQAPDNIIQAAHALAVELDSGESGGQYITLYILSGFGLTATGPFPDSSSYTYAKFCITGYPVADKDPAHDQKFEPGYVFK